VSDRDRDFYTQFCYEVESEHIAADLPAWHSVDHHSTTRTPGKGRWTVKSVTPEQLEALLAGLQFVIEQLDIQVRQYAGGDEWSLDFLLGVDATKNWIAQVYQAIEAS
jgi:hypothetical protein